MQLTSVNKKIVISGKIIEVYDYQKPYIIGFEITESDKNKEYTSVIDKDGKEKRNDNLYRAKRKLRRLINANITDNYKFIALTYENEPKDRKQVKHDFKIFIQRLTRTVGNIKYIAVVENGAKNDRLHIHMIIFDIGYISNNKLRNIWRLGFVRINRKPIDNMGAYISKYITKQNGDDEFEKNSYMRSKRLKEPIEIINEDALDYEKRLMDLDPIYENVYNVKHGDKETGALVVYKQYNTKRGGKNG